jgi:putative cell wall-binding protein
LIYLIFFSIGFACFYLNAKFQTLQKLNQLQQMFIVLNGFSKDFFLISALITQFLNVELGRAKVQPKKKTTTTITKQNKFTHNYKFNGHICTNKKRSHEIKLKVKTATHVKKTNACTCVVYHSLQAMKK